MTLQGSASGSEGTLSTNPHTHSSSSAQGTTPPMTTIYPVNDVMDNQMLVDRDEEAEEIMPEHNATVVPETACAALLSVTTGLQLAPLSTQQSASTISFLTAPDIGGSLPPAAGHLGHISAAPESAAVARYR